MIRVAVSTQLWGEETLGERQLRMVAESGFRTLELFAAPSHFEWEDESYVAGIAGVVRRLGLSVFSLHAPWAPGQDIAALDEPRRRSSVESVKRAVDDLVALQGAVLVLHPGATPDGPEHRRRQLEHSRGSIAEIAAYCRGRGVRIALENPPPYELGGDNTDLLALYQDFADEPTVQACFDTGHAQLSPDRMQLIGLVPKEILLVHISDNGGRQDDHWFPSPNGSVRWGDLFRRLRERRFDGCLMLELTDLPEKPRILSEGWKWMSFALAECSRPSE